MAVHQRNHTVVVGKHKRSTITYLYRSSRSISGRPLRSSSSSLGENNDIYSRGIISEYGQVFRTITG